MHFLSKREIWNVRFLTHSGDNGHLRQSCKKFPAKTVIWNNWYEMSFTCWILQNKHSWILRLLTTHGKSYSICNKNQEVTKKLSEKILPVLTSLLNHRKFSMILFCFKFFFFVWDLFLSYNERDAETHHMLDTTSVYLTNSHQKKKKEKKRNSRISHNPSETG